MFDIIRDPLWNNITRRRLALAPRRHAGIPAAAVRAAARAGVPRLPGRDALAVRARARRRSTSPVARSALLKARGELQGDDADARIVAAAALLHDIGHYPFSHALEEIGAPHHEDVAGALAHRGAKSPTSFATEVGPDAPERVFALIRGRAASPLQGLISGSLDLDKIEYLKRDALMCGVPYGEIDVDRLIHSLAIVNDPGHRARDGRRVGEGALGARVAAVRQVPDVPERLLAPRRAERDGDVQAARGGCDRVESPARE